MTEPVVIAPVLMKDVGDCFICCLSMLTGRPYADVYAAIPRRKKGTALTDGLPVTDVCRVAKRLGFPLRYHTFGEEEERAIGILVLHRTYGSDMHMVMYAKRTLIHPGDGLWYTDLDAYLKKYNWRVEGFLWRTT